MFAGRALGVVVVRLRSVGLGVHQDNPAPLADHPSPVVHELVDERDLPLAVLGLPTWFGLQQLVALGGGEQGLDVPLERRPEPDHHALLFALGLHKTLRSSLICRGSPGPS